MCTTPSQRYLKQSITKRDRVEAKLNPLLKQMNISIGYHNQWSLCTVLDTINLYVLKIRNG